MASLREIKDHIASVRSTLKITSAMKLVSSSKLRKAQRAIENLRPYETELEHILSELTGGVISGMNVSAPAGGKIAIVAIAGNSSLCGGFNANAVRRVTEFVSGAEGRVTVYSLGRKMADAMKKAGYPSPADYSDIVAHPSYERTAALSTELTSSGYDAVYLIYNHFVSTSRQEVVVELFSGSNAPFSGQKSLSEDHWPLRTGLRTETSDEDFDNCPEDGEFFAGRALALTNCPVSKELTESAAGSALALTKCPSGRGGSAANEDYIVEPGRGEVVEELEPLVRALKLYAAVLDSAAAEQAARTVAMQTATDNAEDLLAELTLEYNKGRQQKITSELQDIQGGSL